MSGKRAKALRRLVLKLGCHHDIPRQPRHWPGLLRSTYRTVKGDEEGRRQYRKYEKEGRYKK